jgi:metal-responsive CopG/Arc/MetJ family transcriptional regulator
VKTIAITIEDETLERVDRLAASGGSTNRSKIIRLAVDEYLTRLERAAREAREREALRRHAKRLARETAALVKEQAKL